jgi:predicted dehydrogenase
MSAASYQRVLGANDRVQVAFIGFGLIGKQHVADFKKQKDADLVAMCEVYQPRLEEGLAYMGNPNAKGYSDFRKMYENKDIQGVVISTPDHWHALQTILACAAGKDVYVEKPLTVFVAEGRWMVKAARKYNRMVAVGTQRRHGTRVRAAKELVSSGKLGKIHSVRMGSVRNISPGFGKTREADPPTGLDYDMWLGPAPKKGYTRHRSLYHFRWFWDYSGGQMTNLGAHSLDIVHWISGVTGPAAVTSAGGRHFLKDNCEVPDTQDTLIEYPGFGAVCQIRECAAGFGPPNMGGLEFHGTRGSLKLGRDGFEITADKKENPTNIVARIIGGHPVGGPQPVPEPEPQPQFWTEPEKDKSGDSKDQYVRHTRNFLDCVKSRKEPISDLEGGHRITTVCHLANLSLRTGRQLRWDAAREEMVGDAAAAAMLARPYRAPWDKELRALKVS